MSKRIKFHYHKSKGIGALAIRMRLASVFNHVSIEVDNGLCYEAGLFSGVHKFHRQHLKHVLVTETIPVSDEVYDEVIKYLESKVGMKYDFKAIAGFIVGMQLQDEDGIFCSEYARGVLEVIIAQKLELYNLLSPGQHRLVVHGIRIGAYKWPRPRQDQAQLSGEKSSAEQST